MMEKESPPVNGRITTLYCLLLMVAGILLSSQDCPNKQNSITLTVAEPKPIARASVNYAQNTPSPTYETSTLDDLQEDVYAEDDFVLYDIALSEELQRYTYERCSEFGLSYKMVLTLMYKESTFRVDLISSTGDYGIMQINRVNHQNLKNVLGVTDFLDAKQCIDAGTYMLSQIAQSYEDIHMILMVYNNGAGGAKKLWNQGIYSTAYSRGIVEYMEKLEVAHDEE